MSSFVFVRCGLEGLLHSLNVGPGLHVSGNNALCYSALASPSALSGVYESDRKFLALVGLFFAVLQDSVAYFVAVMLFFLVVFAALFVLMIGPACLEIWWANTPTAQSVVMGLFAKAIGKLSSKLHWPLLSSRMVLACLFGIIALMMAVNCLLLYFVGWCIKHGLKELVETLGVPENWITAGGAIWGSTKYLESIFEYFVENGISAARCFHTFLRRECSVFLPPILSEIANR